MPSFAQMFRRSTKNNGSVNAGFNVLSEKNWKQKLELVFKNCPEGVNTRDEHERTILMRVVASNPNLEIIEYLVEELKADVNLKDDCGQKAFHMNPSQEIQIYLLGKGTVVDEAMLMFAAMSNHLEVARYMIEMGFDVNHITSDGQTALVSSCTSEMRSLLVAHGAVR